VRREARLHGLAHAHSVVNTTCCADSIVPVQHENKRSYSVRASGSLQGRSLRCQCGVRVAILQLPPLAPARDVPGSVKVVLATPHFASTQRPGRVYHLDVCKKKMAISNVVVGPHLDSQTSSQEQGEKLYLWSDVIPNRKPLCQCSIFPLSTPVFGRGLILIVFQALVPYSSLLGKTRLARLLPAPAVFTHLHP